MTGCFVRTIINRVPRKYSRIAFHLTNESEKIPTTQFEVFKQSLSTNAKTTQKGSIRSQFRKLPRKDLENLQETAKKNLREVNRKKHTFNLTKLTGFTHFIRRNTRQWTAMPSTERAKYEAEAAKIRKLAVKKRDKIIAKYHQR